MDVIEVDPKLFVTCRLCLDEMGQYQIVPSVQQQIKYCFDINVEPFDGLPQLICSKCKEILSNFYATKKRLCEKQTSLIERISEKKSGNIILPLQVTVSSSQPIPDNIAVKKKPDEQSKRTNVSSESESSRYIVKRKKKKHQRTATQKTQEKWNHIGYKKEIICTVCDSAWANIIAFQVHFNVHRDLKEIYPSIFEKKCSVTLKKIDNKPNITGVNDTVVYSENKVIQSSDLFCYIRYSKETNDSCDGNLNSEASTDTEQSITKKPKRRKRQILSRSSTDTIVIERHSNNDQSDNDDDSRNKLKYPDVQLMQVNNDQCINIDDSSDSDETRSMIELQPRSNQPNEASLEDYKTIQQIIDNCVATYQRKNLYKVDKQVSSESQLKRKVLNIGRKVISRPTFNWTGLLKYMDYKDLGIIWSIKPINNCNVRESNYVRIVTKLKESKVSNNGEWVPVCEPKAKPTEPEIPVNLGRIPSPPPPPQNTVQSISNNISPQTSMDTTAIFFICTPPADSKSKLLNANPVANPKQLPRKLGQGSELQLPRKLGQGSELQLPRKLGQGSELRINKVTSESSKSTKNNSQPELLSMPIITSTTSLAASSTTEQIQNSITPNIPTNTNTPGPAGPRIKVKPITELVSETMLNSLMKEQSTLGSAPNLLSQTNNVNSENNMVRNDTVPNSTGSVASSNNSGNDSSIVLNSNVWAPQYVPNVYVPNIVPLVQLPVNVTSPPTFHLVTTANPVPTTTSYNGCTTVTSSNKDEFIMLHTVELPNTKTNSPFRYLKNLLQLHKLTLFDSVEPMPQELACLIKFKVQFRQDPIDPPVILCLSLHCNKNMFCLTVRDKNQKGINVDKITPNWQWEILNLFRGELVDKLLQNAQKQGQDTHEHAKKFLALLRSINFVKDS